MTKTKKHGKPLKSRRPPLLDLTSSPKEKIHWALKLLAEKGHKLGVLMSRPGEQPLYEIDGKPLAAGQVYSMAAKHKEWNDRLGLGTALLPQISSR
jgi:hypothetical protein